MKRPSEIRWRGPQGSTVRLNEEMVILDPPRCPLDEGEIRELIGLVETAMQARGSGSCPVPQEEEVPF